MKPPTKRLITTLVLTVLLLTPTLPAWADGAPAPGLFGWLQGWVQTAMSWVTGGVMIDPNGLQGVGEEGGVMIDPGGLQGEGDVGPRINPLGLQSDGGAAIDPAGVQTEQCSAASNSDGGPCNDPWG